MGGQLVYNHRLVSEPLDMKKIDRAFFRTNVIVSTSFLQFTLLDRLLHR